MARKPRRLSSAGSQTTRTSLKERAYRELKALIQTGEMTSESALSDRRTTTRPAIARGRRSARRRPQLHTLPNAGRPRRPSRMWWR